MTVFPEHGLPVIAGYEVLAEVARGGMGVVYKARRIDLDRLVALKVLIDGEHATFDELERFHREARAAAKLDHPGIVRIFEAGADGPRHFFTMEFVEGESLSRLVRGGGLTARRAMEITRKVAHALACAHGQGILHRDVKPSNVLIDAAGEPRLADFGLARDLSSQGLTAPGATLGTPAYASPEQLAGETARVGPRSDVYSLGATLYEMLTGRAPFGGENVMETLAKVLYEEPVPPRRVDPRVPPEAEIICLKAMEKDPDRRYASADELAEEIRRWLDGEPIAARPTSWIGRRLLRARRSPRAIAAAAGAVLVVLLCGTWIAAKASLRQENVIRGLEDALRWERGSRGASERGVRRTALTNARLALVGVLRLDPGHEAATRFLGQIDREIASIDAEEREERERADEEAAAAEAAVRKADAVSRVLSRWKRLLGTLARLEACFYDSRATEEERRGRADALWPEIGAFMRETPNDAASQAAMRALAGWARVLSGRPAEGLAWMREASDRDADVPLGALMEALVCFCRYLGRQGLPEIAFGRTGIQVGAPAEETAEMKADREAMDAALARAGKARVWGKEGAAEIAAAMEGLRAVNEGRYADAEEGLTRALDSPDLAAFGNGLLLARSTVRYLRRDFNGGREDLEKVLQARPNHANAWESLGRMKYAQAIETAWRGVDPRRLLDEAIEAHTRSLGLDDGPAETWNGRSIAWHELADAEAERGGDPRHGYAKAIADIEEVLRRLPKAAEAWTNRANLRLAVGRAAAARGEDPRRELARGVEELGQAIALAPRYAPAYLGRGNAWKELGNAEAERGGDPRGAYQKAIEDYGRALDVRPGFVEANNNRGNVHVDLAKEETSRGGDPRELYRKAIEDYEAMISALPESPEALHNHAYARVLLAEAEGTRGGDPRPILDEAIGDYTKAIDTNPNDAATWNNRGNAWMALGEANGARGTDPRPWLEKAIADFEKALSINPRYADARVDRGNALADVGEAEMGLKLDARGSFEGAIADYDEALRLDPDDAAAFNNRGNAWMKLGDARKSAGEDGKGAWEKALADFDAVLARNPRLWQGRANRGLLFERLERWQEAVREYDAAIDQVGENAPQLKAFRDRAMANVRR